MPIYSDALSHYITDLFAPPDTVLQQVLANLPVRGLPEVTIRPEEGRFLQFLVSASGARQAVEIGTLGGYSGIWLARGLPPEGRLITLERDPLHAEVAREHFALAGLAGQVEVRLGDARQLLPRLAPAGPFDFCFIDAEKRDHNFYMDWALANLRPGGVVAAHNAFRRGAILDAGNHDPDVEHVRAINRRFATDPRLVATIFPAGDGLAVGVVQKH
jgi:caffeoyl-CoA O-methyltransferase